MKSVLRCIEYTTLVNILYVNSYITRANYLVHSLLGFNPDYVVNMFSIPTTDCYIDADD